MTAQRTSDLERRSSFRGESSTSHIAENEVKLLLIEPRSTPNTGDAGGERTAEQNVWI